MIDEVSIAQRVRDLHANGFKGSEGYYLVVLSPTEARELLQNLFKMSFSERNAKTKRRYKHPPRMLIEHARLHGYDTKLVIDNALVVTADHALRRAGTA